VEKYKLTPSDAVIALTCRYYGIDVILTFDEDFKRAPWLKVIPSRGCDRPAEIRVPGTLQAPKAGKQVQ